ncbi:hypothetical protein ACIQ9Q_41660 [Streptomyces sp. NPDC094438]|uniref:hypothetical protein n=1 Tax=Streptomyces sp. NPDC094438 TaxID=3366061 RepID=UPI0037FE85D8
MPASSVSGRARRRAAGAGLLMLPLLLPVNTAVAVPQPSSSATALDLQQADQTARSPRARLALGEFLAHERQRATADPTRSLNQPPADDGAAPTSWQPAVPVHVLDPDFVTGTPGAPPVRTEAAASTVTTAAGQSVTIKTAPHEGQWTVLAISSGDDEARYARAAGPHRTAFLEPQANAWYAWRGDTVQPLDATAEQLLGAKSAPLADYQALVRTRYQDKMPGSAYAAEGLGGGVPTPSAHEMSSPLPLCLAGLTAVATLAAGWTASRRAHRRCNREAAPQCRCLMWSRS